MGQTGKYLKKKLRKARRLYRIVSSVCRRRKDYLGGLKYLWKRLKKRI
ncbi:MAG: hypothetical protein HFH58_13950 [Lachnospiraceae bacterium]|nr:hypothetical protein [Lachnospiraceae bacterium]MCI9100925.1 hypothetical protein [Lachnospiraceae bacterium]